MNTEEGKHVAEILQNATPRMLRAYGKHGNGNGTRTRLIKIEDALIVLLTIITCSKNWTLNIYISMLLPFGLFRSPSQVMCSCSLSFKGKNGTYMDLFHEKVRIRT